MKFLIDFKQFFIDIFKSLIISLFISLIIFGNYYIEERYRITTTICNKTFKWFVLVFVLLQIVFFLVRRFIPNFSKLIINCFKDNNQTYIP